MTDLHTSDTYTSLCQLPRTVHRQQDTPQHRITRRALLGTISTATFALAGCLGGETRDDSADDDEETDKQRDGIQLNGITLDSAFPIRLRDADGNERLGEVHYHGDEITHWHGMPLEVPHEDSLTVTLVVSAEGGEAISLGDEHDASATIDVVEGRPRNVVSVDVDGSQLVFRGRSSGSTELLLSLHVDGVEAYTAPELSVVVG